MNGETCSSTKLFALVPCLSCTHSVLPFPLVPGSPSPHSTPCSVPLQPDPASHQLGHLPVLCAPTRLGQRVSHGWGEPDTQESVLRLDSGLSQSHAPVQPRPPPRPYNLPPASLLLSTSPCWDEPGDLRLYVWKLCWIIVCAGSLCSVTPHT